MFDRDAHRDDRGKPSQASIAMKVIDGEDPGGITEAVGWKGGGFRYYRLAPSLLEQDRWGNRVINRAYNAAMLAEALCKLEGFTYAPLGSRHKPCPAQPSGIRPPISPRSMACRPGTS